MTDLAKLVVTLEAQTAQYQAELAKAQSKLGEFSGTMNSLLGGLAEKIAAAFTVEKIVEFVAGVVENAAQLERLAQSTGIAVEELSALQYAAKQSGVDTDSLAIAMRKLNVNIAQAADPASKSAAAFRAMGADMAALVASGAPTATILKAIADKFAGYADGANKTALAVQLFGRAGEQLIPFLNKGSAGIADLEAEIRRLGGTIDDATGKEAQQFESSLGRLKGAATGLGISIAKDILPTLTDLINAFTDTAGAANSTGGAMSVLAGFFKGIAAVVSTSLVELQLVGNAIGGVAAAIVAAATGKFKEAGAIWRDISDQDAAIQKAGQDRLAAIWRAGGDEVLNEYQITAKKIKDAAPDLFSSKLAAKAIEELEKAIAGLKERAAEIDISGGLKKSNTAAAEFAVTVGTLADKVKQAGAAGQGLAAAYVAAARALDLREAEAAIAKTTLTLREQVATFGLSRVQADAFKYSTGALGEEIRIMGEKGDKAKAQIIALDVALEKEEGAQQFVALTGEVQKLTGELGDAGAAAFDLSHKLVAQTFSDTGNAAGTAQLQNLKELTTAQNEYNKLQEDAALIDQALASKEAAIAAARATYQITDLAADKQQDAARVEALGQLTAIGNQMNSVAASVNNPNLAAGASKFNASLKTLGATTQTITTQLTTDFANAFATAFASVLDGTASLSKAFHSLMASIEKDLADLVAKDFVQRLIGSAAGGGATGGGWIGAIAGLFGGGKAGGGAIAAGTPYLVGEDGPEIIVPGMSGSVIPNSSLARGGKRELTVHQYFNFPPGQMISRPTQLQVGATAARGISQASRRNN